ncbi:hypothetical protein J5868_00480 [Candidatus Saccharibacteria bacterium]|nr:hypothetical protein [Candidatus Saccharibacteria bacterium]
MSELGESLNASNRKLIVLLSVLTGFAIALIATILVVTSSVNVSRNTEREEYERIITLSTEDCEKLKSMYSGGLLPKEVAEEAYDGMMAEAGNDNIYKVNLTLCYVQHIRYHGATFDEVLALLKALEPYLSTDDDWIDYYDRLVVYYVEEDDWDKVSYYADLRDDLMRIEDDDSGWGDEYDDIYDEDLDEYEK